MLASRLIAFRGSRAQYLRAAVFGLLLDLSVRGPFGVYSHYFPLQRRMISPLSALDADAVGARMILCTSICSQSLPFFASSFSALHPAITRRGRSSHALTNHSHWQLAAERSSSISNLVICLVDRLVHSSLAFVPRTHQGPPSRAPLCLG